MKSLLIMVCLTCLFACGQGFVQTPAFKGAARVPPATGWIDTYYPTNINGYPALSWWVAANVQQDGSGFVTNCYDYSGNGYNLTNNAANVRPAYVASAINGRPAMQFDGSNDILRNSAYTNGSATHGCEVIVVASYQWTDGTARRLVTESGATTFIQRNATTLVWSTFGLNSPAIAPTNIWLMLDVWITPAANGAIYTNNVTAVTGPASAFTFTGFGVGGRYSDGGVAVPCTVAEIVTYATNLTAAIRTNLYQYFTNKYGVFP